MDGRPGPAAAGALAAAAARLPRPRGRFLAVFGLCLLQAGPALLPGRALPQGTPSGQDPAPGPAACGDCHDAVHGEWRDSAHARAYVDPLFQQALARRKEPERCLPCHVPGPVLDRLGQMPHARAAGREDGIACLSCHGQQGTIHGPNGSETEAHPTTRDPAFGKQGSVALCRSCHDLRIADVLPLAREFAAAGARQDGETCIGCHMETVRRPAAREPKSGAPAGKVQSGRSHRLRGPADPEFCGSAFTFRVKRRGGRWQLLLGNGAGHGVPGLARLRSFPVRLSLLDARGRRIDGVSFVISSDNRLLAEEERSIALPATAGAVAVRVEVDHVFAGRTLATVVDRTLELP